MPKKKPTKQRTRKRITGAAKKALEENVVKLGTSSTNGYSTVFREHGKTIELSCEVEPPVPMQQPLLQNVCDISVEQELGMDLHIKQELLDNMNSNKEEQLLDSINLLESDAVSTLVNHAPSIEIKKEKDIDVTAKANSIHVAATESDQKLNDDFSLGKLTNPEEAQSSTEQQNLVLPSEPTVNDSTKLDSQRHIEIKQELLTCELNSSPPIARLNSTVKVDSKFDKIQHPTISDDFISDSSTSLLSANMKKSDGSSERRNSIFRQCSFSSDSSINDTENMQCDAASSDLRKVKPLHEKSNQLPLIDIVQTHETVLQTNQESNGTLSVAVSSSNEQFSAFNTDYSKTSITASLENIQTAVCQDAGRVSGEVMSDTSNASTIISIYPANSASPPLNSNNLLDDNSGTRYKTLRKIKEEIIDTEIDSSMTDDALFDNSVLSNERERENSQPEGNQTLPYSDRFLHSWGLVNLPDSEEVADESVFSELGTHLRLLGYQQEKTQAIKTFGKKALKEHGRNKKLTIDHLLLEKLFPSEIPQTSEENKLEEKFAKLCLPPSVPATIAKVEYTTRNLDHNAISEIAQTGVQNANRFFEPEVEKVMQMDLQDADNCFESKVEKISQMDSQDADSGFERQVEEVAPIDSQGIDSRPEKTDINSEGTFKLDVQTLKEILKKFPCNLNENVKDSTCETESCSASNLSLIENNPSYSQLVSSSAVFDDDEAKKQSPSNTNQLHNTGHGLQEDSDDSCVDNSRAENSDDSSDATVKNLSFEEQLNPELPPKKTQKKKIDNQDAEFVPRKKSRYEMIMERKEQEKLLKVANCGVEKSVSLHNTSSQLSTNSKQHKDLEIFHPTSGKLPSLQKKNIPKSNKDDTGKEKAKPVTEKTKVDTHDKKKKDEKSNHSGFSDMDAGMRFTNRNSSLFEDISKVAQQPIPCRPRPVPQKNAKSNTNQFTMEEVHAQIDTDLISLPEPQKRKLSVKDYLSRNKPLSSPPPPLNRDILHTETRVLPTSTQPFPASHLIQDPRLTRRQSGDSSPNLKYIRSYQPNVMAQSENVLQLNNSMQTSTSCGPANSDHNIWNNSLSQENRILPTMGPVSTPMHAYLLHSNVNSPPHISSFLSPLQTPSSDDMNLCDSEPPIPPQTIPPVQFRSSHRTQNFDSIRSSASSSYLRDPRLLPTSSHYSGSPLASAIMSSSNVSLPGPRSEDDPYEVNLLPLRLSQSVGQTVMSVPEALMIVLSWVPAWFKEVDRPDQREPPPLWRNTTALKEARPCYEDMAEHFTTVFPLMLFDLFFRMHDMHKSVKDKNAKTHVLDFVKSEIVGDMMEIEAKVELPAGKPHFTIEGQLAVLTYALKSGKKRDVFGFISNQYIYLNHTIGQEVLHVRIKIIHGVQNLNKKEEISVFPFYPLSKVICQIDALGYIDISPLRNIILKPSAPACTRIVLERFGSLAENVHIVNRAIEKIKDGISLNEPEEPRILIIDSPLGTDLMSTLIAVIEDVKKSETPSEKQPILICTRSMKQLVNISLRLLPTGGKESSCPVINTTILVKAKGISDSELKKLTLEHKIIQHMKSVKRTHSIYQEQPPEDLVHKEAKKGILKNSDVVLSHIPQSYDSSIQTLFGIGKDLQFSFCIVDEAYTFTEPEVSLPLLYGIKKLILAGDPKEKPRVVSKISEKHKFYQALPSRLSFSMTS